jgi:hypothetical protein
MNNGAHIEKGALGILFGRSCVRIASGPPLLKKRTCGRLQVLFVFVDVSPVMASAEEVEP